MCQQFRQKVREGAFAHENDSRGGGIGQRGQADVTGQFACHVMAGDKLDPTCRQATGQRYACRRCRCHRRRDAGNDFIGDTSRAQGDKFFLEPTKSPPSPDFSRTTRWSILA